MDPESDWWPGESDVLRWASLNLAAVAPIYEAIAAYVARGYNAGELSFDFCDGIVNGLYDAFLELRLKQMPPLYYDVFLAFDEGEYPHRGDEPGVDPIRKYTNPRIAELVAGLRS